MEDMEHKISKLPKWAQEHIQQNTKTMAYLQQQLDKVKAEQPKSRIYAEDQSLRINIPEHESVNFQIGDNEHHEFRISFDRDRKKIRIHGSDSIAIKPTAGNVVDISLEPSWR